MFFLAGLQDSPNITQVLFAHLADPQVQDIGGKPDPPKTGAFFFVMIYPY